MHRTLYVSFILCFSAGVTLDHSLTDHNRDSLEMGPPKNRWTETEEAAFKAGMAKHGIGKWSEILKDPEFKIVLSSRTNVNLKV